MYAQGGKEYSKQMNNSSLFLNNTVINEELPNNSYFDMNNSPNFYYDNQEEPELNNNNLPGNITNIATSFGKNDNYYDKKVLNVDQKKKNSLSDLIY